METIKKFINRNNELSFLESEFMKAESSLVVIYGRRRAGKTALISRFIENKDSIYFLATEESDKQNKQAFKNIVIDSVGNIFPETSTIDTWEIIFKSLVNNATKTKKVVVIDEFQYLGKVNLAFPSIFQRIWDLFLKDKNIMIILCGSLISMMERQTLSYSSPLYGRRTGQIKLKQIPFKNYNEFFVGKDTKELIELYSITGGIPRYIELFKESEDIYTAIKDNILSKSSFLYDEPNFLLQHEVREIGSYFSIMKVIAAGNQKLGKIASVLGLKQADLTEHLKTLIDLDILEKEIPITETNPEKSKRGLYRIKDNFLLFWFQFVFPNISYLEAENITIVIDKIKKNLVNTHISRVYEDICRDRMWELIVSHAFNVEINNISKWWNGNSEIDIVAINSDGNDIIFGECKYWINPVGLNVLKALEEKGNAVIWKNEKRNVHYVLFGLNGFTPELKELAKSRADISLIECL